LNSFTHKIQKLTNRIINHRKANKKYYNKNKKLILKRNRLYYIKNTSQGYTGMKIQRKEGHSKLTINDVPPPQEANMI